MRILIANDGASDGGGVQAYLDAVVATLVARGHELALAFCTDSGPADASSPLQQLTRFHLAGPQADASFAALCRWAPDVCFAHNMHDLAAERRLASVARVVKFMHGYFGTCISALKTQAFPSPQACERTFGAACVALFLPRRCGGLSPVILLDQLRWARAQRAQFALYDAVVVASAHMRQEFVAGGIPSERVHVNPLFSTVPARVAAGSRPGDVDASRVRVGFLGRMTSLKGGDVLIRAARHAARRLGRPVPLTLIGDGPQRAEWEALAAQLHVPCTFTGWLHGDARWDLLRDCALVAVPSVWPEPFGLVGLEANSLGVPAIAPAAGGVSEWLRDGVNGVLAPAPLAADTLGDALARTLADPHRLRVLRAGARRVAAEMTVTRHVDRLEPLLRGQGAEAIAC